MLSVLNMADNATQAAATLLNALATRFITAQWPELPDDWNAIKDAEPGTPEHARLDALSAACTQARAELQSELLRPEIALLTARLRVENKYMTVLWILFKTNMPFELMDPAVAAKARGAVIFSTTKNVPHAFDAFFGAVKDGGIPLPLV